MSFESAGYQLLLVLPELVLAVGAMVLAALKLDRRAFLRVLVPVMTRTAQVTSMIFLILIAATMFSISDVSGKIALESGSDVLSLLAFRSVVGIGLLFAWLRLGAASVELPPRLKWISLGLGLLLTLNLFGVFKAIELVPV